MPLQHIRSSTANKRPVATSLADGQISVNYHTDSPGIFIKDSNNSLVKIGPIHVGPTAPNVTPAGSSGNGKGEGWLDTAGVNPILKIWTGSVWATVHSSASGSGVTTSDVGTVTGTMIADGTITNVDISATAEIQVSKLANGTARQLLQTAANGTDVEWATNIDVPGTLDVTGVATFDSNVSCTGTGAIAIPDGTTAERPGTPAAGMIRLNTTIGEFEGYKNGSWGTIGSGGSGGASGGGSDQVFYENDQVVTTDYTITIGKNAVSAGPISVNPGITVTVPPGSVWTIV